MSSHRRNASRTTAAAEQAALEPCKIGHGYPQLTIRMMAAIGQRIAVRFTSDGTELGKAKGGQAFLVLDPDPAAGDELTAGRRAAVLAAGQELANSLNLKVAAVFSASDATYFRPGEAATSSTKPPVLALELPDVQFVRPADPNKH